MNVRTQLLDKAKNLPKGPGCYLMQDAKEGVLYVGKAKNLKSRVSSYFQLGEKTPKTQILVGHIHDFDFILTASDAEAFVLENNLIKKHAPKYNVRLKDDKSYPYIICDKKHEFPRLVYQRQPKRNKNRLVFGPFATGSNVSEVMRILVKGVGLRDCSDREFKSRDEACLLFQMKQCLGPCVGMIGSERYKEKLEMVINLFRNKPKSILSFFEDKMKFASDMEEYEKAAIVRDDWQTLVEFTQKSTQKNAELKDVEDNLDVWGRHEGELETDISVYLVRNGLLLGSKNFHYASLDQEDHGVEDFCSYIHQYYSQSHDVLPDKVILDLPESIIEQFSLGLNLSLKAAGHTKALKISTPIPKYKSLAELTFQNAFEGQRVRISQQTSMYLALSKLQDLVGLKERPRLLECYDIAIWQGKSPTAAKIVFHEGKPDKKHYRHYHLKTLPEGNNDFAMMKEVLERRLEKGQLPDLFIVDGGVAQVNVFVKVLAEKEIDIPVIGIAKARNLKGSQYAKTVEKKDERLIIPGRQNPFRLSKIPSLFRLIVQMRDEAHRFSRRLHHKKELHRVISSWVDQVPGIGPKTKKRILRKMDLPLQDLKNKNATQLQDYFQVSTRIASNMKRVLDDFGETSE